MTREDCKARTHEIGLKYMDLSKSTEELAEKFKNRTPMKGLEWDFDKLHKLYSGLSVRFRNIGQILSSL